jgi:hypothetical protein
LSYARPPGITARVARCHDILARSRGRKTGRTCSATGV